MSFRQSCAAYVILGLAVLLGCGSLAIYILFLFFGSFNLVRLGLSETAVLVLDACLCLTFFIQHSFMIRKPFRRWLGKFVNDDFYQALYAITSGVFLLTLIIFWQQSSYTLAAAQGGFRWFIRVIFFLAIAGMGWSNVALGVTDTFGLYRILWHLRCTVPPPRPFVVRGPYMWVRHPQYFCSLLLVWGQPDLPSDRLLFNILFTGWVFIGIFFEERDLVGEYGDEYRDYQHKVPMLIPYRRKQGVI